MLVEDDAVVLQCRGLAPLDVLQVMEVAVTGLLEGHTFLRYDDAYLGHQTPQRHLGLLAGQALTGTWLADLTELALYVPAADPPASIPSTTMDDTDPVP